MRRESIRPWMIWGDLFILIYIVLIIYGILYNASYESNDFTDFGGWGPLIVANLPGLILLSGISQIIGIRIVTGAIVLLIFIINLLLYFWFGASIGMIWEMIRKFTKKNDRGQYHEA